MALSGRVCLVTGASRGIGKGIALQLGEAGATVYITGRSLKTKEGQPGSLEETANEVKERGGTCIPVACDHSKDNDVKELFEKIKTEQDGRLDLLVNNAYAAVDYITNNFKVKFWDLDPAENWDISNAVGLRNHFLCTTYAARLMVPRKNGLIVNVSSFGGLKYLFNVPYGIGKQAVDRMAADCAVELYSSDVTMVSLWPGAVRTEKIQAAINKPDGNSFKDVNAAFEKGETPEYAGKAVVHLLQDENRKKKTGKILLAVDLGDEYGFLDKDGIKPMHMRCIKDMLDMYGWKKTSWFVPQFIKIPSWMVHMAGNKF